MTRKAADVKANPETALAFLRLGCLQPDTSSPEELAELKNCDPKSQGQAGVVIEEENRST